MLALVNLKYCIFVQLSIALNQFVAYCLMCVHFTTPPPKVLTQLALFDDLEYRPETYPKYKAPIIRKVGDETVASLAGFGLVPHWARNRSFGSGCLRELQ